MEKINWIEYTKTGSPLMEAYRSIRTNILSVMNKTNAKLIAFTSLNQDEEKSTVIAEFAITMAQAGKKVLLVDGNLANPLQHILFGISNQGFMDCITNNLPVITMVQHCEEQSNLDVLCCGNSKTGNFEVFLSDEMQQFFETVRETYDCVFVDMPSLATRADAIVCSSQTDGAVLIVTKGEDKLEAVIDAKVRVQHAGSKVLGCIIKNN